MVYVVNERIQMYMYIVHAKACSNTFSSIHLAHSDGQSVLPILNVAKLWNENYDQYLSDAKVTIDGMNK